MLEDFYMRRCLELAIKGKGSVAPNPMVGAVLVKDNKIIGEGWHQQYGGPHAEVNAINQAITHLTDTTDTTLYVSLEPCAHFGKTPPCADLIINHKIPKVVIGCRDPFAAVNGKGIEKLQAAGVQVDLVNHQLEKECKELNKRFFTFHTKQRPYIILKWAQTGDGKIASPPDGKATRLLISNEYSNCLVHQWRSEEAAILIGTNTALLDNPDLTTRLWPGKSPVRLVVDMNLRLPISLKVLNGEVKTIVFNSIKQEEKNNLLYYKLEKNKELIPQLLTALYPLNIQSVLVEGGATLLQSFIEEGVWDEVRVIQNSKLNIQNGLNAPILRNAEKVSEHQLFGDTIQIFNPKYS
jgi:diaminohydroxyphosphoribosylaminopyrimidine deaminase / 5-amino-6-(5-phosphoribosylamino)uracil reductase